MNKVILMGRLTSDPELRQTQSGISSCRFTIACDRRFADKNTGEKQADFITCIAWKQTAEFVSRYFSKGKMISVEGTLRTGSFKDKKYPEITHYTTDVLVDNVEFCGDKSQPTVQNVVNKATAAGVQTETMSYGNLSDFEEILSDGDVPF